MKTRLSRIKGIPILFYFFVLSTSYASGADEGSNALTLSPFANMEKAREYGNLYMSVDKKKMKHRRRILIEDLHVDPLFRKMPAIAYLEVGIRFYGPGVDKPPVGGLEELYDAAFSLIAGILHICCNQKTQLLAVGPPTPPPRHYLPPGAWGNIVVSTPTPNPECSFDPSKYRSVDMKIRWSVQANSSMVEFTGDSNIAYNDARHETMLKRGYDVKWLIDMEHKILERGLDLFQPKGTCILTSAFSYTLKIQLDGPCLTPFTLEKQTALLERMSALLVRITSVYIIHIKEVYEMVSVPGWDASVRLQINLAKYDNSYLPTMEEALTGQSGGIFVVGPNGLSPIQEVMAKVGLTLTSARVVDLVSDPSNPVSDRDWLNHLEVRAKKRWQAEFQKYMVGVIVCSGAICCGAWYVLYRHRQNMSTSSKPGDEPSIKKQVSFGPPTVANTQSIDPLWDDDTIPPQDLEIAQRQDGSPWALGSGSNGTVYKGWWSGVHEVAIKVFTEVNSGGESLLVARKALLREVALLKSCRSPFIVQFLGVSFVGNDVWLCMEYMEGGNLFQAIERNKDWTWRSHRGRIALDVAKGMAFLHSHGVIHLDLKSPNILLMQDWTAKVADVGLSFLLAENKTHASNLSGGTFTWTAPEILMYKRATFKSDVFSFGVILWELVTGEQPRRGRLRDIR
eukprot:jgi/Botrbrau1/15623/Bobra.4_1s0010.2